MRAYLFIYAPTYMYLFIRLLIDLFVCLVMHNSAIRIRSPTGARRLPASLPDRQTGYVETPDLCSVSISEAIKQPEREAYYPAAPDVDVTN
jgi:hypothetical protein